MIYSIGLEEVNCAKFLEMILNQGLDFHVDNVFYLQ